MFVYHTKIQNTQTHTHIKPYPIENTCHRKHILEDMEDNLAVVVAVRADTEVHLVLEGVLVEGVVETCVFRVKV